MARITTPARPNLANKANDSGVLSGAGSSLADGSDVEKPENSRLVGDVHLDNFAWRLVSIHFPISDRVLLSAAAFAASRTRYSRHATRISSL